MNVAAMIINEIQNVIRITINDINQARKAMNVDTMMFLSVMLFDLMY